MPTPPTDAQHPAPSRRQVLALPGAAVVAGLAALPFIRHARAADVPHFDLGVASGTPRPDGMVLWTRLTGVDLPDRVPVLWELAHDEAFTQIAARGIHTAERAWAHSVHAEPAGLDSDRWYFYRFTALGQRSPVGRTRTAPAPDAPARLRAALTSCQRWEHGEYAAWRHLSTLDLDLVMFAGDYIYEYGATATGAAMGVRSHDLPSARTLDDYRRRYALYKSDPHLQAAHAAAPWLLIADDHEVDNDCAAERSARASGAAFLQLRAAGMQAWWEHQPLPLRMRPVGPAMALYGRHDWGRLARIHALDTRQFRDAQACPDWLHLARSATVDEADCPALADPSRSMLGLAQERWLEQGWDLDRPWNLLLQTTLMARWSRRPVLAPGTGRSTGRYWTDGWDGYAPCRRRLLGAVAERRLPGAVVLGGDVHAHYAADLVAEPDADRAPIVASEFVTSSISSHGAPQLFTERALRANAHLRYGRSDRRGAIVLQLDERRCSAELLGVDRHDDAQSPVRVDARFVVELGRPGVQKG